MNTTTGQFDLLGKLLDVSATRHRAIAANIANVNTPGYRRQSVSFEEQLAKVLKNSDTRELSELQAKVVTPVEPGGRIDGNNVDIDKELGALSKNSVMFDTYSQLLASKISMMHAAISGRP